MKLKCITESLLKLYRRKSTDGILIHFSFSQRKKYFFESVCDYLILINKSFNVNHLKVIRVTSKIYFEPCIAT